MSVVTTADENLDKARECVKDAIKALSEILINECWGYDEFREEFKENMHESMLSLMEVKKKLG